MDTSGLKNLKGRVIASLSLVTSDKPLIPVWGSFEREGSRKRGKPNMRCIDSQKDAVGMSLQELSRAAENQTRTSLLHKVARSCSRLNAT